MTEPVYRDYTRDELDLATSVLVSADRFLRLHQVGAPALVRDRELSILFERLDRLRAWRQLPTEFSPTADGEELGPVVVEDRLKNLGIE